MGLGNPVSLLEEPVGLGVVEEGMLYGEHSALRHHPLADQEIMAEQLPSTSDGASTPMSSFIQGILKVAIENNSTATSRLCTVCKVGTAHIRCNDCPDILCTNCVRRHIHTMTRPPRLPRLSGSSSSNTSMPSLINFSQSASSSLGSSWTSLQSDTTVGSSTMCNEHFIPLDHSCNTCKMPCCEACIGQYHSGHDMSTLPEAMERYNLEALALLADISTKTATVKQAAEHSRTVIMNVAFQADQASANIRSVFRRAIDLMRDREHFLINRVDAIRHIKHRRLMKQLDDYRSLLQILRYAGQDISNALERGGVDVVTAMARVMDDVSPLRFLQADLTPCEDEQISFVAPTDSFMQSLLRMGQLMTAPAVQPALPAPPPREIGPALPAIAGEAEQPLALACYVSPRKGIGRPIFGYPQPVICRLSMSITPYMIIGSEGRADGEISRPWGVTCHRSGVLIVADRSNNRIQLFNPDGTFRSKFGGPGRGEGQFERPAGVAVDSQDRIIVVDKDNHRVQIFTFEGAFILAFGEKGVRPGQFHYPWDVAVNSIGHIVVSDTRNHRVQLFSPVGVFLNKYGFDGPGKNLRHFDMPRGVCFTPAGNIVVTDFNNHQLVIIDAHMTRGQTMGSEGDGCSQFFRPQGIVCDDEGRIVVADSRNNRIQVFDTHADFLCKIGEAGKGPGELDRPSGICLTPEGRIAVVDFGNNRVQIY